MAETVKKAKAPAKPRKTATKKETPVQDNVQEIHAAATHSTPTHSAPSPEKIAELACKYWAERGWQDGYAEQDWLRAEQELRGRAS